MSVKNTIYLLLFCFSIGVAAQNSKLKFERKKIDHGTVEDWANPPARFVVTNNGYTNLSFLPTFHTQDVYIVLPKEPIAPRMKGEVLVYYYTGDKGTFSREVEIYSNFDSKPLKLTVKGNIKSFSGSAHLSCPGAPPVSDPIAIYEQKVLVYDAVTGKPLQGAKVTFVADKREKYNERTLKGGFALVELPPGLYKMEVGLAEYHPYFDRGYINRQTGTLEVPLKPIPKPEPEEELVVKEVVRPKIKQPNPAQTPSTPKTPQSPRVVVETEEEEELVSERVVVETEEEPEPIEIEEEPVIEFDEKTGALSKDIFQANNIVFLIDVSLSMRDNNKLEELKTSMKNLAGKLRDIDQLTIITYNNRSAVAMPTTSADQKATINAVIDGLVPKGSTRGVKGLEKAYRTAEDNFIYSGNNQIILATDGKFSEVDTDDKSFYRLVKNGSKEGVILSVLGFGQDKKAAAVMSKLAKSGDGAYIPVTEGEEQVLLEEIMSRSRKEGR